MSILYWETLSTPPDLWPVLSRGEWSLSALLLTQLHRDALGSGCFSTALCYTGSEKPELILRLPWPSQSRGVAGHPQMSLQPKQACRSVQLLSGLHRHRTQSLHTRAQRLYLHGSAQTLPRVWALQTDPCFIPGATAYSEWINPIGRKSESSQ